MKHNLATSTFLLSRSGGSKKAGITQSFSSPKVFVFCSPIQNTRELGLQQVLELNTIVKQPFTRTAYTLWRITSLHYTHGIFEKNHKITLYKNLWTHRWGMSTKLLNLSYLCCYQLDFLCLATIATIVASQNKTERTDG